MTASPDGISASQLIDSLCKDLEPVKRCMCPVLRALIMLAGIVVYTVAVIVILGIRGDLGFVLSDKIFMIELSLALALTVSAVFAVSFLCIPDMCGQKWLLAVPLTLFAIFVLWACIRGFDDGFSIRALHWHHCLTDAVLFGLVPTFLIMTLSRRGKTTRPLVMAAMTGFAVAGLGYVGLRLTCGLDEVGHGSLYHILPFVMLGLLLGSAARRIYRW